ncbi:hypothetical protein JFL43_10490 [Viridibacillus sp. YIM B01967]|uniref:Uncharacterized protein n=1 Tax=Viridibacillus soli TaxID=2798301 RepID=A0ABS1H782_9BACL|nr:hypothetical protein [Viridibacillus soli]MBK3495272.1 hypothetical protein [Viridibacillus soli]
MNLEIVAELSVKESEILYVSINEGIYFTAALFEMTADFTAVISELRV